MTQRAVAILFLLIACIGFALFALSIKDTDTTERDICLQIAADSGVQIMWDWNQNCLVQTEHGWISDEEFMR